MKFFRAIALIFLLAPIAYSQTTPAPIPFDSAVLTWTVPTTYASGGSLPDPVDIQYIIEVSGPGGNGFGPMAIVRNVTTYRIDNLVPGLWSFRIKTIINGASFGQPSVVGTKNVVPPTLAPPVVVGVLVR